MKGKVHDGKFGGPAPVNSRFLRVQCERAVNYEGRLSLCEMLGTAWVDYDIQTTLQVEPAVGLTRAATVLYAATTQ